MRENWGRKTTAAVAVAAVGAFVAVLFRLDLVGSSSIADMQGEIPADLKLAFVYAATGVVVVAIAGVLFWGIVRGIGLVVTRGGPLYRAYRFCVPDSPIVQMVLGIGLILTAAFLSIALLTPAFGNFTEEAVGGADLATDQNVGIFEGDTAPLAGESPDRTVDTDGDGLPDEWERRGSTPGGVPLPDADPMRKDIYVQVLGADSSLSATEREQLRRVWGEMNVSNPDGSTGVTLHFRSANQTLDSEPMVAPEGTAYRSFYSRDRLGERRCLDRLVILGEIDDDRLSVRADAPGYAAVVDTPDAEYPGSTTFRVATTTHALLHTVVGGDGSHADDGWLSRGTPEEWLGQSTARQLNETGFQQPASYPGC